MRHKSSTRDAGIVDPVKFGYLLKELDLHLTPEEVHELWHALSALQEGEPYVDPTTPATPNTTNNNSVPRLGREGSRPSTSSIAGPMAVEPGSMVRFEAFRSYWMSTRRRDVAVMDMLRLSQVAKALRKK
jgi:hypothetical protein